MQKIAQEVIHERASLCNIKLLGPYVNCSHKIPAECLTCGHRWEVNPTCLKRGQGCPRCAIRKRKKQQVLPLPEVKARLQQKGYELAGDYTGSHREKLSVRCLASGYLYEAQAGFLLSRTRPAACPHCTFEKQMARLQQRVQEARLELLEAPQASTNGIRKVKLLVRCQECNHEWKTKEFSGCPRCVRERRSLTNEEIGTRLSERRLALVRLQPRDRSSDQRFEARVRCLTCEHEFNLFTLAVDYLNTHGCPRCLKKERGSLPERSCIALIERLTGWKFPRIRPSWLKGRSSRPMEFDGYNEAHQVAIEFQGPQHYKPIYGERHFRTTKRNDKRKRELARYHGVLLICVPYWKKDPEAFIRKKLVTAGLLEAHQD